MTEPRRPRPPREGGSPRDRAATPRGSRPRATPRPSSASGGAPRRPAPRPTSSAARRDDRRPTDRPTLGGRAWAALAVGGALALLLVVALAVRATHGGRALPGTTVAGIDVGGRDADEIRTLLRPELSGKHRLLLRADDRLIRVALDEAGYRVDLDATAADAVRAGRHGFLGGIPSTLAGLVSARDSAVAATIDDAKLRGALDRVERQIGRKPYPGALSVDPGTLEVTTKPSRAGRSVDRARLTVRAGRELMAGRLGPVDVPLKRVSAVPAKRLAELADAARAYVRRPMRLTGAGAPLELTPERIAPLLALQSRNGGRTAVLGVAAEPLDALLGRLVERGDRAPRDARISAPSPAAGVLTEKGDVRWKPRRAEVSSGTARPGRTVDRKRTAAAVRRAVAAGKHTVRVPTTAVEPKVSTAAARKVRWLIGTFTTPYVAGQPRVTNIRAMADAVDGTVIPAGGSFSLNGITGERTKAKGYVEAPFIAGNKIEPSVGGGVSQFSTTTYNAAYFAGLRLDAFRAHSLYIDRYPPGRESTLNFPDIDLRWTNDTGAPVLVRAGYDDAGVTVALYGDNGGRTVTATAGERQPVAGGDFEITVTRKIRYADGRTAELPVTTRYENEVVDPPDDEVAGDDDEAAGDAAADDAGDADAASEVSGDGGE